MIDLDLSAALAAFKQSRRLAAEAKPKAAARNSKLPDPERVEPSSVFTNPDNWVRTRGVALIHEETSTLLGNFSEYVHKTEVGCRRLMREDSPIAVAATEYTDWLPTKVAEEIEPPQAWFTKQTVFLPLHLDKLGVQSAAAEVIVHLAYGNVARVELACDTQFLAADGQPEQLLWLSRGVNILLVMSLDSKINLRLELQK